MSWLGGSDFEDHETEKEPWSSIVDLMSSFTLVLFLAVTFFIINYNRASFRLKERQKQLDRVAGQLAISLRDLKKKTKNLKISKAEEARLQAEAARLAKKAKGLRLQMGTLSEKQKKLLLDQQQLLAERKKLLAEQKRLREEKKILSALVDKKELLAKKNKALVERQKELTRKQIMMLGQARLSRKKCEEKLRILLQQRRSVLSQISSAFSKQGKNPLIGFDINSGKIRLGGQVLFGRGSDKLTEEGKRQMGLVFRALDRVIRQKKIYPLLAGIMVEGHTSSTGKTSKNWSLSTRRALQAVQYMLSLARAKGLYKQYARLFFAAGFGQFRPVMTNGKEDLRRSRRIEVQILFKEQKEIQKIIQHLKKPPPR